MKEEQREREKLLQKYEEMKKEIISNNKEGTDIEVMDNKKFICNMKTKLDAEKQNKNKELKNMDKQKEKVLAQKREKDAIKGKLDSIQTQYSKLMKKIKEKRERILSIQKKQTDIEVRKQEMVSKKNNQIRDLQVHLKRQMFFIQNLIPKSFIQQLGNSQSNASSQYGLAGHSIHNLRKPLSIHTYEMEDSYLCPYPLKFSKKNIKKENVDSDGYPILEDIMRDGKTN